MDAPYDKSKSILCPRRLEMTEINQKLKELIQSLEPFKAQMDSQVVGYVVRANIYSRLNLNKDAERVLPSLGRMLGVPIYADLDQQEQCIEFKDAEGLKLYLNRKGNPRAWGEYLARIISP
jgi:hypothetical protein